jgi:glycosyltransferase involved in cell wall biosynthesis
VGHLSLDPLSGDRSRREETPGERIKVMEFITLIAIGGTERQLMNLVRHLDTERFELHMGCFKKIGSFLPELEQRRVPIEEFRIDSLFGPKTLLRQLELARYLRRERIQVVQTHGFYPNVFALGAAWLAGVPVRIASVHDQGHNLDPLKRKLQRISCAFAHRVVCNAEAIKRVLVDDGYDPDKVSVIYNGIDLDRLRACHERSGRGSGAARHRERRTDRRRDRAARSGEEH